MRHVRPIILAFAWLLACGAHWDVTQCIAWGRMLLNYSETMPLAKALQLTFSPDNLCGVCEFVAEHHTRTDDDGAAQGPVTGLEDRAKNPCFLQPDSDFLSFLLPTDAHRWNVDTPSGLTRQRAKPPTEPPREIVWIA